MKSSTDQQSTTITRQQRIFEGQDMKMIEQKAKQGMATRLTDAITQDHFILYGQPIVAIGPGRDQLGYIEVLVRYVEEEAKLLPPGGFFEILESVSLMSVLDRWVLNRVVRTLVGHHDHAKNWDVPRYSVNLSTDSLYDADFLSFASDHLHASRLPQGKLWFEIAESDAHAHAAALHHLTSSLEPTGCGFALSAYTGELISPASLATLGVGAVKIDDRRILPASSSDAGATLLAACRKLKIQMIAEMVEYAESIDKLRKLGIEYAQGFAIAAPAPLKSLKYAFN